MSQNRQKQSNFNPKAFTPKRVRRTIKLDRVQASDLLNYDMIYACEQCSFFDAENTHCVMGFLPQPHLKEQQMQTFNTTGHMAFCRFLEID